LLRCRGEGGGGGRWDRLLLPLPELGGSLESVSAFATLSAWGAKMAPRNAEAETPGPEVCEATAGLRGCARERRTEDDTDEDRSSSVRPPRLRDPRPRDAITPEGASRASSSAAPPGAGVLGALVLEVLPALSLLPRELFELLCPGLGGPGSPSEVLRRAEEPLDGRGLPPPPPPPLSVSLARAASRPL